MNVFALQMKALIYFNQKQSNLFIKTTHERIEIWSLFTGGLYLEGQFQRFTNKHLPV